MSLIDLSNVIPLRPATTARDELHPRLSCSNCTDQQLLSAPPDDRDAAFAELFRRHSGSVAAVAKMVLGAADSGCEHVVAEVFASLWFAPEKFDPERGSLLGYLRFRVQERSIDLLRGDSSRRRRVTSEDSWRQGVREPERLAALTRSGLLDTGPDDAFDRLTELAAVTTGAARACITLVDATHYAYKSTVGVAEGAPQSGPVEASFCRYVVGSSKPFVVEDTCTDPRTRDNPESTIDGVAAWAGYPIEDGAGWVLGTFCLVATEPHNWTDTELHVLATLARAASSEIALRRTRLALESARDAANALSAAGETEPESVTAGHARDGHRATLDGTVQLTRQLSEALSPSRGPKHRRW